MKDVKIWSHDHNARGGEGSSCRLRDPDVVRNSHQTLDIESDDERALEALGCRFVLLMVRWGFSFDG